jgi:hypothetical protein
MRKTWEQMTPEEKIEDLRSDVKRIFLVLSDLKSENTALAHRVTGAASLASEVAKKVETLSGR